MAPGHFTCQGFHVRGIDVRGHVTASSATRGIVPSTRLASPQRLELACDLDHEIAKPTYRGLLEPPRVPGGDHRELARLERRLEHGEPMGHRAACDHAPGK